MVLSQDKVLQRFVEQIIDDDKVGWAWFNSVSWSRTSKRPAEVWRESGGAVLRRDAAPGRARAVLTWTLFQRVPLWQSLAPIVHATVHGGFWKNFTHFLCERVLGS